MAIDWASVLTQPSPYAQAPFSNLGPYSVAAPNTQGLFVNNGGNLGPAANAFLRSDMRFGLSNTASDFSPQAVAEFLSAAQSGQVAVNPNLPPQLHQQAQQILQQLQTGSIAPQQLAAFSPSVDANQTYSPGRLLSALGGTTPSATGGGITSTGGTGGAGGYGAPIDYSGAASYGGITSRVFGAIPGTPEGTMPTVQLRQLLEQSLEADRQAQLARDQFNQQISLGNQQLALQAKTQADDLALRARQLDQQAAQFSQTYGLQTQEQQFRQQLATQQLQEQQAEFGQTFGLQTQAQQFQQGVTTAGLTGTYGGQQTQQSIQLQAQIRQADQQIAQHQQELDDARRAGDADRAQREEQFISNLQVQRDQMAQQASQFGQTFGLQQAGVTGSYNGQETLASRQFSQNLTLQYAQLREQIASAQREGDLNRANQLQLQATQLESQAREHGLDLQFQYAQLQQQGTLATAGLTGVLNGQETLAGRQQRLAEEQAYQQLAAHPENLIQAALAQSSRTPGGIPVTPGMTTPVDANGNPLPNAPAGLAGAVGAGAPQAPLPGVINALLQRQAVPGYGPTAAQGQMVSFADLQNNPALRLNPGALDLASLGNLGQTEQGYLASILAAQGQDVGSFTDAVKRARAGQSSSALMPAF
jgi:hypothetical protein